MITQSTLEVSYAVTEAEQVSVVTTQVGVGTVVEQPPAKLMVSTVRLVYQPGVAVAKSVNLSGSGVV